MTGLEYYRRKMQLSICELSRRTGITATTLQNYERTGIPDHTPVAPLIKLATELDISLDELLSCCDGNTLSRKDRKVYSSNIISPKNIINNYRISKNLRYEELAELLLRNSRESARVACRRETALGKHIRRLSDLEHTTPEELIELYSEIGEYYNA